MSKREERKEKLRKVDILRYSRRRYLEKLNECIESVEHDYEYAKSKKEEWESEGEMFRLCNEGNLLGLGQLITDLQGIYDCEIEEIG